ncbi:hypothetical protein cypCar_00017045 [Cyprinus carpio]|nr:hypothetical protein cypCar_00017045 [Cyprinus carpio]
MMNLQDTGTYFPSVKRCPGRYLQPCSDAVKRWLRSMKNSGKILLLITSSHSDYCRLVCEHILGSDFEELFDIIITNALKPGFFSLVPQQRPFRTLVDDVEESEGLPSLEKPGWYSQGNWPHLHELLKNMTNKTEPKVVYFGDSMRSDMFPACSFGKWETVMIVEEMEGEGVPRANATPSNSPTPSESPAEKKGKFEFFEQAYSELAVALWVKGKGLVWFFRQLAVPAKRNLFLLIPSLELCPRLGLLSPALNRVSREFRYSPFDHDIRGFTDGFHGHDKTVKDFTDGFLGHDRTNREFRTTLHNLDRTNEELRDGVLSHDRDQGMKSPSAVSNQWGSYFVDVQKNEGEETRRLTWCCHSIHTYSTMAIPSIEAIADLPLDFKFQRFFSDKPITSGYYPRPPDSLLKWEEN